MDWFKFLCDLVLLFLLTNGPIYADDIPIYIFSCITYNNHCRHILPYNNQRIRCNNHNYNHKNHSISSKAHALISKLFTRSFSQRFPEWEGLTFLTQNTPHLFEQESSVIYLNVVLKSDLVNRFV